MSKANFWDDQEKAQKTVSEMKALKELIGPLPTFEQEIKDLTELLELAELEEDEKTGEQVAEEHKKLLTSFEAYELKTQLSGKDDGRNVYLSIHAGAGGTESCDWADMLVRMYLRWTERKGLKAKVMDRLENETAGIRSATLKIEGPFAYGLMKSEIGVHRLVRISPFDATGRRHTSFASVDITPEFDASESEEEIPEKDLDIKTSSAGGPGGQNVNKVESAVQLKHLPTGIMVRCTIERSQIRNRVLALEILKAKLRRLREIERDKELQEMYGEKGQIAFGSQIRSYFLQPYTMVNDHRTELKETDAHKVLDGDLDPFIDAYLRYQLQKERKGQGTQAA